jgi:hypothetical protein
MSSQIFDFLKEFTNAFGPIISLLPESMEQIQIFSSYIPINFDANIVVKDTGERYYFEINPSQYFAREGNLSSCPRTFIGLRRTWIQIFTGRKTLMGAFNNGEISMSDTRVQYILRLTFLSEILFNFVEKRQKLIRAGKYLRFPLFSRTIMNPIVKIMFFVLKLIPTNFFERMLKRLTPMLQSD